MSLYILGAAFLLALGWYARRSPRTWFVLAAIDGDTLLVLDHKGRKRRARILGIDAPERGQPLYAEAKKFLHGWLARTEVSVRPRGRDCYARELVVMRANGVDVAKELVERGLAFPTRPGQGGARYYVAKAQRQGVWAHRARPAKAWSRRLRRLARRVGRG